MSATARLAGTNSNRHWPFLDLIRFGAALLVLFGHARGLLFEGIARVEHPNAVVRGFYLISGLQHEGVVMFFIVSGFLVGGSAWRLIASKRFDWATYLINRFARIYLVLIPAFALVLALDVVGKHFFLDTRFYGVRPLWPAGILDGWDWMQIPCHLLAVQGLLCAPWGADPPLWSLGFEWALYLVAPVVFVGLLVPMPPARRIAALALAIVVLAALTGWNGDWPVWFSFWMLGVAASHLFAAGTVKLPTALAGLLVCATGLIASRLAILPPLATDIMVGAGLALALTCPTVMAWSGGARPIERGAGFSYSLYLVHLPVCVFVGALLERWGHWPAHLVQPDAVGLLGFATMVGAALAAAYLFARCTEDHTARAPLVDGFALRRERTGAPGKLVRRLIRPRGSPAQLHARRLCSTAESAGWPSGERRQDRSNIGRAEARLPAR
jgi:peptidoglycan/LPS O-acetylase OafA/YrhL